MIAEGAKRILEIPTIKKEPISVVHLQEIVKKFCVDCLNLYNVRICAMYYTLFCWFSSLQRYYQFENVKFKMS